MRMMPPHHIHPGISQKLCQFAAYLLHPCLILTAPVDGDHQNFHIGTQRFYLLDQDSLIQRLGHRVHSDHPHSHAFFLVDERVICPTCHCDLYRL
ncbi:hypothetical protein SDC9_120282 [bioreactor metagenome]|uniref:Uncharacterized protein n=1 Tax=bioreactor metagenome TaxID=1076179 RepID=A0A645C6J6_9ZZZZ